MDMAHLRWSLLEGWMVGLKQSLCLQKLCPCWNRQSLLSCLNQ